MATITLDYYGMTGTGHTVKEAKLDAGRKIEAALEGDYSPLLVQWRGTTAVFSRNPKSGWGYRFAHGSSPVQTMFQSCCGNDGRDEALMRMLLHVADVEHREGEAEADALFDASGLRPRLIAEMKREFARKADQNNTAIKRRRMAESLGLTEYNDIHDFVWRNPARRDLWMPYESAEQLRAMGYHVNDSNVRMLGEIPMT